MGDKPQSMSGKLSSLFDKNGGKSQARQFVENYFGIQYVGNTIFSVACVNFVKKFMPGTYDKMARHYEQKYIDKNAAKEGIELPTDPNAPLTEKQQKFLNEAKSYGDKTTETRWLCSGGFAMLPFSSAYDVYYKKGGVITNADGTTRKPKMQEVLFGKDNAANMPKWIMGRTVGLGVAFSVQRVVDDRFGSKKEAVDFALARIITKITGGGKSAATTSANALEDAEKAGLGANETIPKDINPKILKNVRMVTSDFYMTSVALGSMAISNMLWEKAGQKLPDSAPGFVKKLLTGNSSQTGKGI